MKKLLHHTSYFHHFQRNQISHSKTIIDLKDTNVKFEEIKLGFHKEHDNLGDLSRLDDPWLKNFHLLSHNDPLPKIGTKLTKINETLIAWKAINNINSKSIFSRLPK